MILRRTKVHSVEFCSNPGNRFYIEKHGEVQPNGTIKLIDDREIDLQEKYNAEYPSTTIDNILANSSPLDNFADNGMNGIDATQLPKTFAEFLQLQIDRKREFDRLPVEVKQKFNNDLNQYMATAGSAEWFDKLGIDLKKAAGDAGSPAPAPSSTFSENSGEAKN